MAYRERREEIFQTTWRKDDNVETENFTISAVFRNSVGGEDDFNH